MRYAMHITSGAGLGHVVHYSVLVAGLVGLFALLGPQLDRGGRRSPEPRDAHERQVAALRAAMAGSAYVGTTLTRPEAEDIEVAPVPSLARGLLLPLAVVSSGAAALAHAAVAPEHFSERTLFGLFFVACALLQLAWSAAVTRRTTPSLLVTGIVGNAAVLALWAATRSVGLPFGLLPEPEAVGPWDLACLAWEAVVVLTSALVLLRGRRPRRRLPRWPEWHTGAVSWLLVSILVLGVLSLIGHGS